MAPQLSIGRRLPRSFFNRDSPTVAADLLGRVVITGSGVNRVAVRLTEVEAYSGDTDPASHAFRGQTPRNTVMFGPPGHLYLYFIYGMYWCANIVVGPSGAPSGVLLRAGEVIDGVDLARLRRPSIVRGFELANGPARLSQVLGLGPAGRTTAELGADVCGAGSGISVHVGDPTPADLQRTGPRVGVSSAHDVPWRFWVADDPTVSKYRRHVPKRRSGRPGQ